jgi:hypothetical protein
LLVLGASACAPAFAEPRSTKIVSKRNHAMKGGTPWRS